jgi:site-specific DNA-methyltransferase (adenine-specific)
MTDFRYCWYWKKNNVTGAPFAKVQPMRCIEDICVFYKHKPTYNPQGLKQLEKVIVHKKRRNQHLYHAHKNDTIQKYTNYPKNLIEFNGVHTVGRMHPTQKPVELLEYLVKTYTNENDTVLDNCMGSGSTGEACINTNRKFIGIEKNLQYFEIAKRRLKNANKYIPEFRC